MKCVKAVEHAECAVDCPDCHDLRMVREEPWPATPLILLDGAHAAASELRRAPLALAPRSRNHLRLVDDVGDITTNGTTEAEPQA